MTQKKKDFKTNMIYGAIVLIPVAIIIVVFASLFNFLEQTAKILSLDSPLSAGMAMVLVIAALLVLCYGIGVLIHTRIGSWTFERLENRILRQVPFYKVLSKVLKGFAADDMKLQPALIQLGPAGSAVMGFVVEQNANDTITVFVPSIPTLTIGNLYVVEHERVKRLDIGHMDFIDCISEWGTGSSKVLGGTRL